MRERFRALNASSNTIRQMLVCFFGRAPIQSGRCWFVCVDELQYNHCGVTTVELPLNKFFMQLLQLSAYKVFILFFGHILRQVLVQKFKQLQEKWSQCHTKPIGELSLAEGGSAAVSWVFAFFMHFLQVLVLLLII